jgi:uncharacterized OB-fold protein
MSTNAFKTDAPCFICGGTGRVSVVLSGNHLDMTCPTCKGSKRLTHQMVTEYSDNGVIFSYTITPAKPEAPHDS